LRTIRSAILACLVLGCGASGDGRECARGSWMGAIDPGASACGLAVAAPTQAPGPRRHVVLLSIDGCRPDALAAAEARNLIRFGEEGTRAARALTIPLSLTLPSHSSMLSGYDLEHHQVTWNYPLPEYGYIKVPTIFARARAAGLRTVMVMGKDKFLTLLQPDSLDELHELAGDEDGIIDQAIFVARKARFDLMFIHLPNPDLTGHLEGWMSPPYLARLSHIDALFGQLLDALPSDATVLVTSDHGGHDYTHGEDTDIDRLIPWMIRGPGIRRGLVLEREILTMDSAATALRLLGLALDATAQGRVVDEAFAP
jgi:predicted AlkP superfamily pyrophosphatase or phosphodiesterase